MGDGFLVQKLPSCPFYVSNHNLCFAQVITLIFSVMFSLLNSDNFSVKAFSCSCILCLFSQQFYGLLSFNFPWYFPEKSGNICLFFRHISFNIQWNFLYFSSHLNYVWTILFFVYLFVYLFVYFFIWFSHFFVLSFWAV